MNATTRTTTPGRPLALVPAIVDIDGTQILEKVIDGQKMEPIIRSYWMSYPFLREVCTKLAEKIGQWQQPVEGQIKYITTSFNNTVLFKALSTATIKAVQMTNQGRDKDAIVGIYINTLAEEAVCVAMGFETRVEANTRNNELSGKYVWPPFEEAFGRWVNRVSPNRSTMYEMVPRSQISVQAIQNRNAIVVKLIVQICNENGIAIALRHRYGER